MNVPVGSTTRWSTILVAVLAVITTMGVVWDDMRQRLEAAGVPPEWTAKAGVIIGLAVISGRYLQAVAGAWGRSSGPGTVVATTGQEVPFAREITPDNAADFAGRDLTPEEVAALAG